MPIDTPVANKYITYYLSDQILYASFETGAIIDLFAAKLIFKDRIDAFGETAFPSLVDSRGLKSITKDARDFLSSDEARKGVKATAILVAGYLSSTIANFFLKVNVKKPKVPTRIFSDKQKAINWLQQFK